MNFVIWIYKNFSSFFSKRKLFLEVIFAFLLSNSIYLFGQNPQQNEFGKLISKINKLNFINKINTDQNLQKLFEIAKQNPNNTKMLAESFYWKSFSNYQQGISDAKNISIINEQLKKFDPEKFPFENAQLHHSLALYEFLSGYYEKSLTNALTALTQYQQLKDLVNIARTDQLLGTICFRTQNFEMAEKFYQESLVKDLPQNEYYKSLINLYCTWLMISKKKEKGRERLQNLEHILEKYNDPGLLSVFYLNLGAAYSLNNNLELAHFYFNKAATVNKKINNKSFAVSLFINLSSYETNFGNFTLAKSEIDQAEKLALEINNKEQLTVVYQVMSELHEKLGDNTSALLYLKKHNSLLEEIRNNSGTIDSYQNYVSSFLTSKDKEITISRQNELLQKRKFLITLIISIFIISLTASVAYMFYQKRKQQKNLQNAEKRALEKQILYEKEIQEIRQKKYTEIVEEKTREVTSYSLMLSSKNDVLHKILQHTEDLSENNKEEIYKILKDVVKNSLNTDIEGQKFIYHFNQVHPDFFSKMKDICASLTENNLRMCAYFKIGIPTKQVAAILNVSTETIKNARYRLKKKLKLNESENLDDFLRKL